MSQVLAIGAQAPDFSLLNQHGERISLSDFRGKKHVILYFYPKDETPGCTLEACGFRDSYEAFTEAGAEVIGVSDDSVESHAAFARNRRLPFQLLSDPKGSIAALYGVKRSLFGLLKGRETFLIDKEGQIRHHVSSQFLIDGHIQETLALLGKL